MESPIAVSMSVAWMRVCESRCGGTRCERYDLPFMCSQAFVFTYALIHARLYLVAYWMAVSRTLHSVPQLRPCSCVKLCRHWSPIGSISTDLVREFVAVIHTPVLARPYSSQQPVNSVHFHSFVLAHSQVVNHGEGVLSVLIGSCNVCCDRSRDTRLDLRACDIISC